MNNEAVTPMAGSLFDFFSQEFQSRLKVHASASLLLVGAKFIQSDAQKSHDHNVKGPAKCKNQSDAMKKAPCKSNPGPCLSQLHHAKSCEAFGDALKRTL